MTKDGILSEYLKLVKEKGHRTVTRDYFCKKTKVSDRKIRQFWGGFRPLKEYASKHHPDLFSDNTTDETKRQKSDVLVRVSAFHKKHSRFPSISEMYSMGIKNHIIHGLGGLKRIQQKVRELYPEVFSSVSLQNLKTKRHVVSANRKISQSQKLVVTTAVSGAAVDERFYKSLKSYCKKNDAQLVIMVAEDPAKQTDREGQHFIDKSLLDEIIVVDDCSLNENIHLRTIKLSAKQIDATTGLDRLAGVGSFIYASPKQRLKPVPVGNNKHIHLLLTTGAITEADYYSEMYMSKRLEYLAEFDHVVGALVVEIEDDKLYHQRHVQAGEDGSFIDLGTLYKPDGTTKKEKPISIWPGDWHTGSTCPMVRACVKDMTQRLKPENFFLNDFFDGKSVNHHIKDNMVELVRVAEANNWSLEKELEEAAKELEEIQSWGKHKTYVVYSNHDDFLSRYLQNARYVQRDQAGNHRIGLKLALPHLDGANPIEYFAKEMYKMKKPDSTVFLKEKDDLRLAGILHSAHGHMGANGSRATSCAALEKVYHIANLGHTHGSEILRGVWKAGTSTYLDLGYNKGPSSWSNSHITTYRNGSRQILYTIEGKYCLDMDRLF